jgi:hypothetical protein
MCRPTGRLVIPPTPPPDIDLEAWRASTDRILAWRPDQLFLTHFGPQASPVTHIDALWRRIDAWSERVRTRLGSGESDEAQAADFAAWVREGIARQASDAEADAYARAGRFDYSWSGLARYWRKRAA